MPTTLIHYFTGTGNTAIAVRLISEKLKSAGHEVSTVQVRFGVVPPTGTFDFHIVAFPVLSWAPPVMMSRYLKMLPRLNGTKVAILAINGALLSNGKLIAGYTGQALEEAEKILRRKKMDVFLTGNASFPDNWTQMTNPCDEEGLKVIIPQGETQVHGFADNFLSEKRELYRCGTFNTAWSWLVAKGFGKIGRRILGTFYIADEKCTSCAICAKTCPAQTIVMEKKFPRWKTRCEDCNRCINICPEKAIQVSLPMMVIQITLNLILSVWFIKGVLDYASLIIVGLPWLKVLVDIPLVILAIYLAAWVTLVPLDFVFHQLIKRSSIRHYFTKSFTKSFRRYAAPGFKPWKE
jgi:Pyruvate/2-oxoacid:ferredoxin oxidoreductase delta subunit/menaquinone-dependent protoporphyrinogen IX oxidase